MIDYHTHTYLCNHATGEPEEYLAAAEAAGLTEIGVSDHTPWPRGYDEKWRMAPEQFPEYRDLVRKMKDTSTCVEVKYAIEADWVPGQMDMVYEHFDQEPFDYIIGSIHYTDDLPFDNPDTVKAVWEKEGRPEWIWKRYYDLMLDMVNTGRFDIIGHFDLPKKFGNKAPDTTENQILIEEILQTAAANNMAIEINTAGLRKPVKELYPQFDLLKKAARFGVMLTFGSDAHTPEQVGANFAEAIIIAKEAGFNEYCSFSKRQPKRHKLV